MRLVLRSLFSLLSAGGCGVCGRRFQNFSAPSAPPEAAQKPIIDMYHGTKVLDNYRWLEDGKSPETQKWVEQEMSYTRGILDPLARTRRHPQTSDRIALDRQRHGAGDRRPTIISTPSAKGMQNQPVLYVRDGLNGPDRVLVDANQLAADGTIALDWFSAQRKRKVCRLRHFAQRLGDEHAAHHRDQNRHHASRHHRAHARRFHRVEARQLRLLLHALSEKRRRPRRPGDVQPPRLLSRTLAPIPRSIRGHRSTHLRRRAATPKTGPASRSPTTAAGC